MIEHVWGAVGALFGLLSMVQMVLGCYLLFVLHRHDHSRWSLVALVSAVMLLIVGGVGTVGVWAYLGLTEMGVGLTWDVMPYFKVWAIIGQAETFLFVVMATTFLGLAVSQRRGKSRVARRRKT